MILEAASRLLGTDLGRTPKDQVGIAGFTTLARVREESARTASVTTNYAEDGTPINDHAILNPFLISIEGNVGDVFLKPSNILNAWRRAQAEIGNVTQYLPGRTQSQISKINGLIGDGIDAVRKVDAVIATGEQAYNFLFNRDNAATPLQKQFIDTMDRLHFSKSLFSVEVFSTDSFPRKYANMFLTSFKPSRDATSDALMFRMECQEVRIVPSIFEQWAHAAEGLGGQASGPKVKGMRAREEDESVLHWAAPNAGNAIANYIKGVL